MAALRDLGAFPDDVDVQHVIDLLGLDRPPVDPTTLTADELVAEMQHSIKTLLGIGARMPKELMLFVKNMMFLDGAIATLAPDLDLFAEVEAIALLFAAKHGERIMSQLGLEQPRTGRPTWRGSGRASALDESTEASPTARSRPAGPRCARSSTGGVARGASGAARNRRPRRMRRRVLSARACCSPVVDLASMAECDHDDQEDIIGHSVDDAISHLTRTR